MSTDERRLDLRIAGYQFPEMAGHGAAKTDWDDANWLMIAGKVLADFGDAWSFMEPCMSVFEAQHLGNWLQQIADGERPDRLDFLEPCLAFTVEAGASPVVVVKFSHRASRSRRFDEPVGVAFALGTDDLAKAAVEWREEAARFPPR